MSQLFIQMGIFIVGLAFLVKGADFFVEASSRVAKRLGVSEFIIGLTLVAFGTSVPELGASIAAALRGYPEVIVGNVVGSNIANIGLILGISAIVRKLTVHDDLIARDGYIMIVAAVLFFVLGMFGVIGILEGAIFLLFYAAYVLFLVESKKELRTFHFREFLGYFFRLKYIHTIRGLFKRSDKKKEEKAPGMLKDIGIIILGLVAVVYGSDWLITSAVFFANVLGVPNNVIALSLIAAGTSLPELTVALQSLRKGFGDMAIGNVMGSNIANILLILGVSSFFGNITIPSLTIMFSAPVMLLFSFLILFFVRRSKEIQRWQGWTLFGLYVVFLVAAFLLPK